MKSVPVPMGVNESGGVREQADGEDPGGVQGRTGREGRAEATSHWTLKGAETHASRVFSAPSPRPLAGPSSCCVVMAEGGSQRSW